MYRSLKMRIEPDSEQRKVIEASFRYHCYVYNALITACKSFYRSNGRLPSQFDLNKLCTRIWHNCPFLHRYIYQNAMNETFRHSPNAGRTAGRGRGGTGGSPRERPIRRMPS